MAAMQEGIREACEAVQAAAPGKDKAAIRLMLAAELQSREVFLTPELVDVLAERIAAGTYVPGEPVFSVEIRRTLGDGPPATVSVIPGPDPSDPGGAD